MFFELTDEQLAFQDSVRRLMERECPPARLLQILDTDSGFEPNLWQGLAEMGIGGITVPEEHGGIGLELLDAALMAEVLGHAGCPGPFLAHSLAAMAIACGGSKAQKAQWLPRLASGEVIGTVALGEGGQAWQPEEWTLPGGSILDGSKTNILFGDVAGLIVVGTAGGELAIVDAGHADIQREPIDGVDRTRRLWTLGFHGVAADVLPDGRAAALRVRDAGLVLLAADAFGGASRCLGMAVEYAKTREQFGRPIGQFQAMKHQLANMALEIEPSRALYWHAAYAQDHLPEEASRCAALAKAHLTEVFMQVARDAVEAHGGIGYTWEYPLHVWVKRAIFDRAFFAAPAVHRERAAALAGW